jgi:glyoxylase-like metal-dependent hydrolase (beta-lactamase superfamily II)
MKIQRVESPLLASNMYVIMENGHAIVIDPYQNLKPAEDVIVDKIILTHEHYDHISGVNDWKRLTNAPVLCSKTCGENIQSSKKNMARLFEVFCELQTWMIVDKIPEADENYTCQADETFEDEIDFAWQGHDFHLFELPGHSLGSIGILLDGQYFFSGDSLMEGKEIELRFPGGSRAKWKKIGAPRLALLPDSIKVYPGHFKEFVYTK